jgi:hypothetical protein
LIPSRFLEDSVTCIILGAGKSWQMDLKQALSAYPDAEIGGCNMMFHRHRCDWVATLHPECRDYLEDAPPIHARLNAYRHKDATPEDFPWVTEWHPDCDNKFSTGWLAAEIAKKRHDTVILCGVPMEGCYSEDHQWLIDQGRLPSKWHRFAMYSRYGRRFQLAMQGNPKFPIGPTEGIYSMSGVTRKYLGLPPKIQDAQDIEPAANIQLI